MGTLYEYDASSRLVNEAVGGNKVTLVNGHLLLIRRINNVYYYYVYNGHGDVIGLLDHNGNVVNEYRYDIWGEITSSKEAVHLVIQRHAATTGFTSSGSIDPSIQNNLKEWAWTRNSKRL